MSRLAPPQATAARFLPAVSTRVSPSWRWAMLQRLAILTIVSSLVCLSAVIVLERIPDSSQWRLNGEVDEGWRRTSAGWERLAPHLVIRPETDSVAGSASAPPSVLRWDFHPAWLACLLVAAATIAFGLFPGRQRAADKRSQSLF